MQLETSALEKELSLVSFLLLNGMGFNVLSKTWSQHFIEDTASLQSMKKTKATTLLAEMADFTRRKVSNDLAVICAVQHCLATLHFNNRVIQMFETAFVHVIVDEGDLEDQHHLGVNVTYGVINTGTSIFSSSVLFLLRP